MRLTPGKGWRRLGSKDQVVIARWARAHRQGGQPVLVGAPVIHLLQVIHRAAECEDRVVVRVRAVLEPGPAPAVPGSTQTHVDQRWTLARNGQKWVLVEFDDMPLADELLGAPIIAGEWADRERLNERTLAELADYSPARRRGSQVWPTMTQIKCTSCWISQWLTADICPPWWRRRSCI